MSAIEAVLADLAALDDPRVRAANLARGDDHGVNLSALRNVAKKLKTQHDLARALWATGDVAAQLVATLICKPKLFSAAELDAMVRELRAPKVQEWLVSYVIKASPHKEGLRTQWMEETGNVGRAGWTLTAERVAKEPDGLDLAGLLDRIEAGMKQADERMQWAMNHTLAEIGIHHPAHRPRAIAIGEKLRVLEDYPTSPGCTSPYAPLWIAEMVRRQGV